MAGKSSWAYQHFYIMTNKLSALFVGAFVLFSSISIIFQIFIKIFLAFSLSLSLLIYNQHFNGNIFKCTYLKSFWLYRVSKNENTNSRYWVTLFLLYNNNRYTLIILLTGFKYFVILTWQTCIYIIFSSLNLSHIYTVLTFVCFRRAGRRSVI